MRELDVQMMKLALRLARKGAGMTSPNPMVGAVVAKGGAVVASGWHRRAGAEHAEALALQQAGGLAAGSTLYVTLEPCVHEGRTPPCVDSIIASGITRVVIAMKDPDTRVFGKGIRKLKQMGVEVELGVAEHEARSLNEAYVSHRVQGRPFVTYKAAVTFDGRTSAADGTSRWITHEAARKQVQLLRALSDAVCVGSGTVTTDDPSLIPRNVRSKRPTLRVVVDASLVTPVGSRVLNDAAPTLVYTSAKPRSTKARAISATAAEIVSMPGSAGKVDLLGMLKDLASRDVLSVLLEGGASLAGSFVSAGLVDRFIYYVSPKLLGAHGHSSLEGWSAGTITGAIPLQIESSRMVGEDLCVTAVPMEAG